MRIKLLPCCCCAASTAHFFYVFLLFCFVLKGQETRRISNPFKAQICLLLPLANGEAPAPTELHTINESRLQRQHLHACRTARWIASILMYTGVGCDFPLWFRHWRLSLFWSPPSANPSTASVHVAGLEWRVSISRPGHLCVSFQAEKAGSCVEMFPALDERVKVWVTEGLYLKIQSTSQPDYSKRVCSPIWGKMLSVFYIYYWFPGSICTLSVAGSMSEHPGYSGKGCVWLAWQPNKHYLPHDDTATSFCINIFG